MTPEEQQRFDDLERQYENFVLLVTRMRHYQYLSETYRASQDRSNYTRYRKQVDDVIKKENIRVRSKQAEIKF